MCTYSSINVSVSVGTYLVLDLGWIMGANNLFLPTSWLTSPNQLTDVLNFSTNLC